MADTVAAMAGVGISVKAQLGFHPRNKFADILFIDLPADILVVACHREEQQRIGDIRVIVEHLRGQRAIQEASALPCA